MVPTKTGCVQVSRKMFLTRILKHPLFSTFQNNTKGISGIVMNIAARMLFVAVVNTIMSGKPLANNNKTISAVITTNQIRIPTNKALCLQTNAAMSAKEILPNWFRSGQFEALSCVIEP
jgi:hypothetical protein